MPSYKVWAYTKNNGDGSGSTILFPTEDDALYYIGDADERMCDDLEEQTLEFDDDGNFVMDKWTKERIEENKAAGEKGEY